VSSRTGEGYLPHGTVSMGALSPLGDALTYVKNVPQQ